MEMEPTKYEVAGRLLDMTICGALGTVFSPISLLWSTLLVGSMLCGDTLVKHPVVTTNMYLRCVVDNMTHGTVAALSWSSAINFSFQFHQMAEVVLCAFIACAIDLDHFYEAGSCSLQAALHLSRRPILHMTSLIPVLMLLMMALQGVCRCNCRLNKHLALILGVAILSHHLRDGHRRGLWLYPLGTTPPLPYACYIVMVLVLVYAVRVFLLNQDLKQNKIQHDIRRTLSSAFKM